MINIIVVGFLSHQPLPKHKAAEDGSPGWAWAVCVPDTCSNSRDNRGSISRPVLVPGDLGPQPGQRLGLVAWLLVKYYSGEFSVCVWTLHCIRLYCKAWQMGGKEGGSVFRFLVKIKVQKQMKLFGSHCCKQNRDMERILDPVARWFP